MGRAPCCDKANVKKGPWSPEEDSKLKEYIEKNGTGGNWIALPQKAGLKRCGKSCRLRWLNYLRPNIKHGEFSDEEDRIICSLYANIGSRWSIIAAQLPGRTDNDIKNYWNTKLKKKLMGFLPTCHNQRKPPLFDQSSPQTPSFPSPQVLSSSMYRDLSSYYNVGSATISFTGLEPISAAPSSYTNFQSPESLVSLNPMQYHPVKDSFLMFGSEGSCSSSDGSCGQISHGREMKQEAMGIQNYMGFEEYGNRLMLGHGSSSNNGAENENNINQWTEVQTNGFIGETPLDYDFEDIKQLISSSSSNISINYNNNGYEALFNIDENKTQHQQQEKAMYYYYH